MNIWRYAFLTLCLFFTHFALADTPTYQIGVKIAKPFVYQEDGKWKGYSVDIIKHISRDLGFEYEFVPTDTVGSLLDMTRTGKVDMSIAAISVTDEREKYIDFTHSYFTTTQGILVKDSGNSIIWWIAQRVLIAIAILVVMMYFVGWAAAVVDDEDEVDNVHKGAWWALVTFTTTGYGDYVPGNWKGKLVGSIWMVASLFLLSIFTGYIASSLTVKRLTDEPTTIQSLFNAEVVTVEGSTSQNTLTTLGIPYTTAKTLELAINAVESGRSNALVYDKAMLDFASLQTDNAYNVWPINRGQERYAIALPPNSSLREAINISILNTIDSPSWKNVEVKYFGE